MKIELTEDELTLIVRALYHYHAYLISQKREDRRYVDLSERLEAAGKEARKSPASPLRSIVRGLGDSRMLVEVGQEYPKTIASEGGPREREEQTWHIVSYEKSMAGKAACRFSLRSLVKPTRPILKVLSASFPRRRLYRRQVSSLGSTRSHLQSGLT